MILAGGVGQEFCSSGGWGLVDGAGSVIIQEFKRATLIGFFASKSHCQVVRNQVGPENPCCARRARADNTRLGVEGGLPPSYIGAAGEIFRILSRATLDFLQRAPMGRILKS